MTRLRAILLKATDEYLRQGLSPEDARDAAQRGFGGVTQTKEVYREVRSFSGSTI